MFFTYEGKIIEIVSIFFYLGITFATGGSFAETHKTLSGQALKAIFKLNQYLYSFTDLQPKHVLALFYKLILPILTYGGEVWGFFKTSSTREGTFAILLKAARSKKKSTQNDFIYGELGRTSIQTNVFTQSLTIGLTL